MIFKIVKAQKRKISFVNDDEVFHKKMIFKALKDSKTNKVHILFVIWMLRNSLICFVMLSFGESRPSHSDDIAYCFGLVLGSVYSVWISSAVIENVKPV